MNYLSTGQRRCYDAAGREIPCAGSGQDAERLSGRPWPRPRFEEAEPGVVLDHLTGLYWPQDANPAEFPMTWPEALEFVQRMNAERTLGHDDWRLPNRRELRSLVDHSARNPALPQDHPFRNVFLGWRWTSTTSAIDPAYAWYVHFEGGRMFYGKKDQYCLAWAVRGTSPVLPRTGLTRCYDADGREISCAGTGQDGELQAGTAWPIPRFEILDKDMVKDRLTRLVWRRNASLTSEPVDWRSALEAVSRLNADSAGIVWRLPTINELESLVDASRHAPALPQDHPFEGVQDGYWSSTTSGFEKDWTYVLYLRKGAVGVGFKPGKEFFTWPVADE